MSLRKGWGGLSERTETAVAPTGALMLDPQSGARQNKSAGRLAPFRRRRGAYNHPVRRPHAVLARTRWRIQVSAGEAYRKHANLNTAFKSFTALMTRGRGLVLAKDRPIPT